MKTRGHVIATLFGVAILVSFSSLTFLYNIPQGPLRERAKPLLSPMDPWLSQNWSFFAPDPPSSDIGILARYSQFHRLDVSGSFVDVTTGGLEATKRKIVPPREYRLLTSALDLFLSAEDSLVSFHPDAGAFEGRLTDRDRLVNDMLGSAATPSETKQAYLRSRQLLIRTTRHFYEKSSSPSLGANDAIQLRLVSYAYPRFEERRLSATDEFNFRTLPWWQAS